MLRQFMIKYMPVDKNKMYVHRSESIYFYIRWLNESLNPNSMGGGLFTSRNAKFREKKMPVFA